MSAFWEKVARGADTECWLWVAKSRTGNGYGVTWGDMGDGKRNHTAHRFAFFLANGRPPRKGADVMHSCDVRLCCNPAHLSEGSRLDNMRDCAAKGRTRRTPTVLGERHHKALLTEAQVVEIKAALAGGERYPAIGKRYGVHADVIGSIARHEAWRHIPDPEGAELRGLPAGVCMFEDPLSPNSAIASAGLG